MTIISNAYPTNMPNSQEVSQGGPANFARIFYNHIAAATDHRWVGVMYQINAGRRSRLEKCFSFPHRDYFKIYIPQNLVRQLTRAEKKSDPVLILKAVIDRTAALLKKEKADVVFLNGFGIFNWVLLKAAEKTDTPAVIQHAGIWTKELNLHKEFYSPAGLRTMIGMEKDSSRLTAAEVFLNTWSRDYYRRHVARREDGATVIIPLPFNFSGFAELGGKNKRSYGDKRTFKIGTIGRWDKIKNHAAFLALAREAKKAGLNWRFYAVTHIPDTPQEEKKKEIYGNYINIIPSLDRKGVAALCRSLDLLILPSRFDVSPTVVLEAMALKTPIVISPNVGFVNDFRASGAKNWIVDFNNSAAALKAVKKLAGKPMPSALKTRLITKHDYQRVFSSYLDLFSAIIIKSKSGKAVWQTLVPMPLKSMSSLPKR